MTTAVLNQKKKKEVFTVKIGEEEVSLAVIRPEQRHIAEAQKVANKTFRDATESGAFLRIELDSIMRSRNLWNDDKQREADELVNRIAENERKLKGGIKLSEAREKALQIRRDRARQLELLAERNRLDVHTADAQSQNAHFNRLVSLCTVYNDNGKLFFNGYEDYLERSDEPATLEAANKLAYMLHNVDPNFQANLPENKFLKKWGMVDEKLRLINKEKKLVDTDGRLINEDGYYINEKGDFVDRDGKPVDKEGNYVVEETPFLDDEGNPILPVAEEEKPVEVIDPSPAKKKK